MATSILVRTYKKILNSLGYRLVSSTGLGLGRFKLVRIFANKMAAPIKNDSAIVMGSKMFLDPQDSLLLSINGIYEEFETELVSKEISENDVVVDIGANIGYYTLIFAKLVGKNGRVFAFEPDPSNFALLKKNVESNGFRNVTLVQKAVSDKNENIKLHLCEFNHGMHRIFQSTYCEKTVDVESIRLDDYFAAENLIKRIRFIKIDAEGSELLVLKGMASILHDNENLKVLTEFAPSAINECGGRPEDLPNLFVKEGFKIHDIKSRERKIEKIANDELLSRYTIKKKNHSNLLCIK